MSIEVEPIVGPKFRKDFLRDDDVYTMAEEQLRKLGIVFGTNSWGKTKHDFVQVAPVVAVHAEDAEKYLQAASMGFAHENMAIIGRDNRVSFRTPTDRSQFVSANAESDDFSVFKSRGFGMDIGHLSAYNYYGVFQLTQKAKKSSKAIIGVGSQVWDRLNGWEVLDWFKPSGTPSRKSRAKNNRKRAKSRKKNTKRISQNMG